MDFIGGGCEGVRVGGWVGEGSGERKLTRGPQVYFLLMVFRMRSSARARTILPDNSPKARRHMIRATRTETMRDMAGERGKKDGG